LYGDWEEAYNQNHRLLGAMVTTNPSMVHVAEPYANKEGFTMGKWSEY
jgi:hypothetical protein